MATEAGVSNFLTKPFSAQELRSVIEETFGEGKASEDEAPEEARLPLKTASGKVRLNVAHIQITDHLTLGVLKHLIATQESSPKYFELETRWKTKIDLEEFVDTQFAKAAGAK